MDDPPLRGWPAKIFTILGIPFKRGRVHGGAGLHRAK